MFFKLLWLGLFLMLLYRVGGQLAELNPIRLFRGQATSLEMMGIHSALQNYRVLHGHYPEDFDRFLNESFHSDLKSVRMDPWGGEYLMERTTFGYILRCAGPDGIHGNTDDFLLIHRE